MCERERGGDGKGGRGARPCVIAHRQATLQTIAVSNAYRALYNLLIPLKLGGDSLFWASLPTERRIYHSPAPPQSALFTSALLATLVLTAFTSLRFSFLGSLVSV